MILDYFNVRKLVVVATVAWVGSFQLWGQSVIRTSSTEKAVWQQSKDRLKSTAEVSPIFSITGNEKVPNGKHGERLLMNWIGMRC